MAIRLASVVVVVALAAACAPTREEFLDACASRCWHETAECGYSVPEGSTCDSYCRSEWSAYGDEPFDCVWYVLYWYDCRADAPCGALDETCLAQSYDVLSACPRR